MYKSSLSLGFYLFFFASLGNPWTDLSAHAKEESKTKTVLLDRLESSVNASLVLRSDVEDFRKTLRLRTQLDPLFAGTPLAAEGAQASNEKIIGFLENERLITQAFPKTDAEVELEINSIQKNNRLDRAGLTEALEREGFSFKKYFSAMRDSSSKREMIRQDIQTKVTIADDDVKNYFYNHYTRNTKTPRAFHLELISISEKSFKSSTKQGAQSLAHQTATQALKDIRSGEAFEEVAKRVSDGITASSGGDLGVLTEDEMQPAIRGHIGKLKIGEVSEIFGTPGQYYIVKLVDIQSNQNEELDKMKEEIRSQLASKEYQRQVEIWLERKRQLAFIHRAGEPPIPAVFDSKK